MQLLEKLKSGDNALDRLQDRWISILNPVLKNRALNGFLLENVAIAAAETAVPHQLDRTGVNWILVSPQADARVWQTKAADDRFVYLQASVAVTAALWVF